MKTNELTGPALNWMVAKCVGVTTKLYGKDQYRWLCVGEDDEYAPSTDWAQGGPIIERENISITAATGFPWWECETGWYAHIDDDLYAYGDTPLVAAMRVFVMSKLGETVDVPEEFK